MRRTVMIGILAALLTSSAGVALANGRYDDRSGGQNCAPQYQQQYQQQGWGQGGGSQVWFSWSNGHRVRHDRRFDQRDNRRFKNQNDRGWSNGRGYGGGQNDPRGSGNGGYGGGSGDGRNHGPSQDPRDARRPTQTPDDRGW